MEQYCLIAQSLYFASFLLFKMLNSYQLGAALALVLGYLNVEASALARVHHLSHNRRLNNTFTPAQTHHSAARFNATHINFNHTRPAYGNPTYNHSFGGHPAWPNTQPTWHGPAYNQTWRQQQPPLHSMGGSPTWVQQPPGFTNQNQTYYNWLQSQKNATFPSQPAWRGNQSGVWLTPSNVTSGNSSSVWYQPSAPVPASTGGVQLSALSPPNSAPGQPISKPVSSNPYANMFN